MVNMKLNEENASQKLLQKIKMFFAKNFYIYKYIMLIKLRQYTYINNTYIYITRALTRPYRGRLMAPSQLN